MKNISKYFSSLISLSAMLRKARQAVHLPSPAGFTLIEFLIVSAILGVIGTVVISVLFTTFRVSRKADGLIELRQGGNAALSQIMRNIRYAKSLSYPTSCVGSVTTSHIIITDVDDQEVRYSCDVAPQGGTITSNGVSLIDIESVNVAGCRFSCSQGSVYDPPEIGVFFRLYLIHDTNIAEGQATIPFDASVILRNYNN